MEQSQMHAMGSKAKNVTAAGIASLGLLLASPSQEA